MTGVLSMASVLPSLTRPILIGVPVALFGVPRTLSADGPVLSELLELGLELLQLAATRASRTKVAAAIPLPRRMRVVTIPPGIRAWRRRAGT